MANYNIPDLLTSLTGATLAVDDISEVYDQGGSVNTQITQGEYAKGLFRFPLTGVSSPPSAPSTDEAQPFYYKEAGVVRPAFRRSSGPIRRLQQRLSEFNTVFWIPIYGGTLTTGNGLALTATGTPTNGARSTSTLAQRLQRIEFTATATSSAVAGWRVGTGSWGWDMGMSDGFTQFLRWSPLTGVIASQRLCAGMSSTASNTDVEPSTLTNCAFFAADSADANLQFMHNDAAGTCTKIDTGIPVPAADRDAVYDSIIHCDPSGTTLKFKITNLVTGTSYESETGTTNLPAAAAWMAPYGYSSVGGVSNVTGISFHGCVIETHGV